MKLVRVSAVARKEFIHIVRDPRSLGMAIAIPMLLLFLFGYALALDVDRVPLMVWDQSQTPASREFLTYFTGSRYFSLQRYATGYPEIERAMDTREALVGLVIPRDFAARAHALAPVRVQAIVDGSDSNTATIAMGYLNAISLVYSNNVLLEHTRRITGKSPVPPVDFRPRVWFNADLESRNYIIPGLIAVIMMVIAALLTSLTVAKEWEQGTMEQLISTPVKGPELVVGKLLPYFALGMLDVLLAVLMGAFVFDVPLRGSVPLLFGVSAVFLSGALSMGILISIVARSQLLASQLAMILTFLPSFLLSGFMFPREAMPSFFRAVSNILPVTFFLQISRGILLKGVGLSALWPQVLSLLGLLVFFLGLSILKFRKTIA